jgi:hypothetical protein
VFIFQFLNGKIYNYVLFDIMVNSIIQKLKNKHTFPKNYTKLSSTILTEREETKTRYFPLKYLIILLLLGTYFFFCG